MTDGCIYCGSSEYSDEHWIPRGLGTFRGYTPLVERVCEACNRRLGRLDEELVRTGIAPLYLTRLGVAGRTSHERRNPMYFRAGGTEPPNKLTQVRSDGVTVLREPFRDVNGRDSSRVLRQLIVRHRDGHAVPVPFPPDCTEARLLQSLTNKDLRDGVVEEFYTSDADIEAAEPLRLVANVEALLNRVFPQFRLRVWHGQQSGGPATHEFSSAVTLDYFRAVVKFAFHYFLWAAHRVCDGNEPEFREVREAVCSVAWDDSLVCATAEQFVPALAEGRVPRTVSHFLGALVRNQEAVVYVQLFAGPNGVTPPHKVVLGRAPLSLARDWAVAHAAMYSPQDDGHDGILLRLTR